MPFEVASVTPSWHFRKIAPAEMNSDPVQGEFFIKSDIVDRLVRETLQNSLDAKKGAEPVRVRFAVSSAGGNVSESKTALYFKGLLPHLKSAGSDFDPSGRSLSYLVIEDFGTTGLTGDPEQTVDHHDNNFYWFFRNVGRSDKGEDKGGSWGLGKWVFPSASRCNAFFALTCRDDGASLLMGQSVLKQHLIGKTKHDAYGFFADIRQDNELQIPFDNTRNRELVETFRRDFGLQRDGEPGLSIIIPFPAGGNEEDQTGEMDDMPQPVRAEDIVRSVIKYYFYPIIAGSLVVEVSDSAQRWELNSNVRNLKRPECVSDSTQGWELNNGSIQSVINSIQWPPHRELNSKDILELLEMARDSLNIGSDEWVKLKNFKHPWNVTAEDLLGSNKQPLIDRYQSGKRLYLQIPVPVKPKTTRTSSSSHFQAVIQKDESVEQGKDYYVRGNLASQDIDTVRAYPVCAFVHIKENEPLAHLLRNAEEPSHSNWRPHAPRAKAKYVNAPQTVEFVKKAVGKILAVLSKKEEEVQKEAFSDIFFVERLKPKPHIEPDNDKPESTPPVPDIDPDRHPALYQLARIDGGFTVSAHGERLPARVRIRLAYQNKANPLTKYSPHDFQLDKSPVKIECTSCRYEAHKNKLVIRDINRDFRVVVTGFDVNRDLYIKADAEDD